MSHLDIHRDLGVASPSRLALRNDALPDFVTVFQPIVHTLPARRVLGYEALVRGRHGEGAAEVFAAVPDERLHEFDAMCRRQAVTLAGHAGLPQKLSLNVLAGAICDPRHGLMATIEAAASIGFPADRLIFEITETEKIVDFEATRACLSLCRQAGAKIAIDDLGSAYNSLEMLLGLSPDYIKLGLNLTQEIVNNTGYRPFFVKLIKGFQAIGVGIIAEGLELPSGVELLQSLGIEIMQGYYFGMPLPSFATLDHG